MPFSHIAGPSALTLEAAEKMRRDHFKWNLNETSAKNVKFNRDSVAEKKIFCTPKNPTILAIGESSKLFYTKPNNSIKLLQLLDFVANFTS